MTSSDRVQRASLRRQQPLTVLLGGLVAFGVWSSTASAQDQPAPPAPGKFEQVTAGTKRIDGLWTLYTKEQQVLVELKQNQLNQDFLVLSSIARGISNGMVIGGMTWGDDVLWQFRKVGDRMHVIRRNVRFRARPGSPEANAVRLAYSDSVLYALPIVMDTPGGHLVDMTRIFLSDDQEIGRYIGGSGFSTGRPFQFVYDRSTIAKVKSLPRNVEIDVAAVYAGDASLDTVADSRGVQVTVHYSISQLPNTGYRPRKADDRVGYFLTVTKDFSENPDEQHFVRYITRWDLQKADPNAKLSPPKEPIIFYMEKTLPINLRPIVRAGIEDWNKAFEKVGFANAIEVRQQRDDDEWDPEDVRYNTFRWITAEAGFAMGPSRVNPLTGQILDADIIFDSTFLRSWKQDYEFFGPQALEAAEPAQPASFPGIAELRRGMSIDASCKFSQGMQHQTSFAAAAMAVQGLASRKGELPEEFVAQALKEVVMHEVGHTLGLRHNFKASGWKSLTDIQDPAKSAEPTVASVMDYAPVNLAAAGTPQGAYYTKTIGPYDFWAIEYGYKPIAGDENAELAKIAARSGEPGLDYGTDEDTRGLSDSDPLSNRFDLGNDPVAYAQRQMALALDLLPKTVERTVDDGEGYQRARQAFGVLLNEYWRTAAFAARLPGGVLVARDHKGDQQARPPFRVVDAAQQRNAMKLIGEQAFGAIKFDPNQLNYLAATRWSHWGLREPGRIDVALHDVISGQQQRILNQILAPLTLARIQDNELKVPADQEAYTLAEHLNLVHFYCFRELYEPGLGEFNNRSPYLTSFRRTLQRSALKALGAIVSRGTQYPDDARVLVRSHLTDLVAKTDATLAKGDLKLDDYSRAHLTDLKLRINQVLNAELTVPSID